MSITDDQLFVIRLRPIADRAFTREAIEAHVAHLRWLDDRGTLALAGPFDDGSGGMVVVRAASRAAAAAVAEVDPFVRGGFRTATVRALRVSHRGNGYLLD